MCWWSFYGKHWACSSIKFFFPLQPLRPSVKSMKAGATFLHMARVVRPFHITATATFVQSDHSVWCTITRISPQKSTPMKRSGFSAPSSVLASPVVTPTFLRLDFHILAEVGPLEYKCWQAAASVASEIPALLVCLKLFLAWQTCRPTGESFMTVVIWSSPAAQDTLSLWAGRFSPPLGVNLIVFNVSVIASVVRNVPLSLCCSEVGVCCHGEVSLLHIKIFRDMRALFDPLGRIAGAHCRSTPGPRTVRLHSYIASGGHLKSTWDRRPWTVGGTLFTHGGVRSNFMVILEHSESVQRNRDPAGGISVHSAFDEVVTLNSF